MSNAEENAQIIIDYVRATVGNGNVPDKKLVTGIIESYGDICRAYGKIEICDALLDKKS